MYKRIYAADTVTKVGESVLVSGWVQTRRDHGGLIFIDLRDYTGIVQLVVNPDTAEAFSTASDLRDEYVIKVEGMVRAREAGLANERIATGSVEIEVSSIVVLNKADVLPIQPFAEAQANEDLRLRYRYLDLRRPKMQYMLTKRAEYFSFMRSFMEKNGFVEVTTPILANSSPEGARDFLIPSRIHPGKVYALPQAPQMFKQLLMVGGLPRYYQMAACFRDEDPRADRLYGEFYQLDLEMSFVEDGEEVRSTTEPLIKQLVTEFAGKKLLTEDVPRIPYTEAMERYGSDKPDLRYGMELIDLTDIFAHSEFSVFKKAVDAGGVVKAIMVKGGASLTRSQIDTFTDIAKGEGAGGLAYLMWKDGAVQSPVAKFLSQDELTEVKTRSQAEDGDGVFFAADKRAVANAVLGKLRTKFADYFGLKDPDVVALCWIVDFPFYEINESTKKVDFGHNPFSMPKGGLGALKGVETDEDKLALVADQYDMVANGYEICSGGVRNHNPEIMYKMFGFLGYGPAYVEEKFGAMLSAFKYGAPPHAGCAYGVDRLFMILMGEDNIREIIAFPKNGSGQDLMMNSPSRVEEAQLKELNIKMIS